MVYINEEIDANRLDIEKKELTNLISDVYGKVDKEPNKSHVNGAIFHIVQIAYFHARHQTAPNTLPRVKAVEEPRKAYYLKKGKPYGKPYGRKPDIILEHSDGTEEWIELKSYSDSTASGSVNNLKSKVFGGTTVMKEFFHDLRLNDSFITHDPGNKNLILQVDPIVLTSTNKIFTWYFQDFNVPKGSKLNRDPAPSQKRIDTIRERLCKKPGDVVQTDYKFMFGRTHSALKNDCELTIKKQLSLRNTRSYFTEILEVIASDFAKQFKEELSEIE